MTECAPVVAVNAFDHREAGLLPARIAARVRGTVHCRESPYASSGRDTFETLGADAEGLVLVKGPNVMRGYLGREDLTVDGVP